MKTVGRAHGEGAASLGLGEWVRLELVKGKWESMPGKMRKTIETGMIMDRKQDVLMGKLW